MTVQHRVEARHGILTRESIARLSDVIFDEALRHEQPDDPRISPTRITCEAMETGIRSVARSSLGRWGLELHHGTSLGDHVLRLLDERYGFWGDDAPRENLFGSLFGGE
jgi:hypothetical protein